MEKINYISLCCVAQPIGAHMFADTLYPFEANARVSANADGLNCLLRKLRANVLAILHLLNAYIDVKNAELNKRPILGVFSLKKRGNPEKSPRSLYKRLNDANIRQ